MIPSTRLTLDEENWYQNQVLNYKTLASMETPQEQFYSYARM